MKRILVVDDNIEILDVFKVLLEIKDYVVFTLANGGKVLETINQFSPHVILLDIFLGGYNGIDICKELKSLTYTKHIPIIMISAHSDAETILRTCQADAFIPKPFDLPHLITEIETQIKGG